MDNLKSYTWTSLGAMTPLPKSPVAIHADQNSTTSSNSLSGTPEWAYTVLVVYILSISVLGIVFNVFVLMVLCLQKKACTVAEIYLTNLAVADLILVSWLPFWAANAANKYNWRFGRALCRLVNLSISINAYCSIYFLVLVSIDRYIVLVYPLSHERMRRPKYAKLGCLLVWGLGLLLSVPTIIYRETKVDSTSNSTSCMFNYPNISIHLISEGMLIVFCFIIPISIISACTFKIIRALNNRLVERSNTCQREQKATTLILAVIVAFLICWVPFHLVKMIEILVRAKILSGESLVRFIDISKQILIYLAFFNSVLNPILYVIVGKNFQKKVKELSGHWDSKRRATRSLTSTSTSLSRSVKAEAVSDKAASLLISK